METQQPPSPSGLLGSLRGLADGLLGSVHDRVELLSVELQEEKQRFIQTLFWAAAVFLLGLLALVFGSLAVLIVFWDTARVAAIVSVTSVYLVGMIASAVGFRNFLKRQPRPFDATLRALKEDKQCLHEEN